MSSSGQTAVAHRPRWSVIGRILLRQWAALELLLLPPLVFAFLEGEASLAASLAGPALVIAVAIIWSARVEISDDVRRIEAVLSIVAVFLVGIALTVPAYLSLGLSAVDAVFEATSALTTTGFTVITVPEDLPLAAHALRAWSQWCGGLVVAVAGLAFLMDRGPVAKALGFADFGEGALRSSVKSHARALLLAYLAITLVGIGGAAVLIPGNFDGPLLALAAVSTGGMTPRGDSLASYSAAAQVFLVGLASLGALSLAAPVLAYRGGLRKTLRSRQVIVFVAALAASSCAATVLMLMSDVTSPTEVGRVLLTTWSVQSTAGFTIGAVDAPASVLVLMIALMAVGGQIGSTAGGVKIDRVRILFGAVSLTFQRLLSPPAAVLRLRLDGEIVPEERVVFAVALVVVYLISAGVLCIAFTLHGLPARESLFDIVSALSTVGAGVGIIGADLPSELKILTVLAMLLGRVEFFGILVLFIPQIWKRRS